jgi:hypothetical protein
MKKYKEAMANTKELGKVSSQQERILKTKGRVVLGFPAPEVRN